MMPSCTGGGGAGGAWAGGAWAGCAGAWGPGASCQLLPLRRARPGRAARRRSPRRAPPPRPPARGGPHRHVRRLGGCRAPRQPVEALWHGHAAGERGRRLARGKVQREDLQHRVGAEGHVDRAGHGPRGEQGTARGRGAEAHRGAAVDRQQRRHGDRLLLLGPAGRGLAARGPGVLARAESVGAICCGLVGGPASRGRGLEGSRELWDGRGPGAGVGAAAAGRPARPLARCAPLLPPGCAAQPAPRAPGRARRRAAPEAPPLPARWRCAAATPGPNPGRAAPRRVDRRRPRPPALDQPRPAALCRPPRRPAQSNINPAPSLTHANP
jgi:hypothetical protein